MLRKIKARVPRCIIKIFRSFYFNVSGENFFCFSRRLVPLLNEQFGNNRDEQIKIKRKVSRRIKSYSTKDSPESSQW